MKKEDVIKQNQEFFESLPFNAKDDHLVTALIDGYEIRVPRSFVATDQELVDAITGGCGPGGFGDKFVPDTLYGLSITLACKVHDWTFGVWNDSYSFIIANDLFHINMLRIIKQHGGNRLIQWLRRRRAYKYYLAVQKLGKSSYLDNHKEYLV